MSMLFVDGFDSGDLAQKWTIVSAPSSDTSTRFNTGRCVKFNNGGKLTRSFTASSKIIVGFAWNFMGEQGNGQSFIQLLGDNGAVPHVSITSPADKIIQLCRGDDGVVLAESAFQSAGWNYIELSATVHDTTGTAVVRVNGVEVMTYTGDTRNGGTSMLIDKVIFGLTSASPSNHRIDDVYICNDAGSTNNAFLGDVRIQTLLPTGAGSSTQFTPTGSGSNYLNVADVPDSVSTYNASSTVGQRDTYAMGDLLASTSTVLAVQENMHAWKSDAGTGNGKLALKSGASVYYGSDIPLGTSMAWYSNLRETNPATAAAWTVSEVNGLEHGAEVA